MSIAPAGWHPDPANPSAVRWWDGTAWTAHTQQAPVPVAAPYGMPAQPYGNAPSYSAGRASFAKRNSLSLTAVGVVALYIVIAMTTRVVFFGIFPVLMAIRATKRKESLAPVAVVAALIALAVAFLTLR